MENQILISMPVDEFWSEMGTLVEAAVKKYSPKPKKDTTTYSISQTAEKLGRGFNTIKKLVEQDVFKVTQDGRIPIQEIEKYLEAKKLSSYS